MQNEPGTHWSWLQVCWEKFTRYFDVEERFVHLTKDCFILTPEKAIELVDENTIGGFLFLAPRTSCTVSPVTQPVCAPEPAADLH